jgi:formylglycine-generating enzyme required for sulfatase activity
MSAPAFWPNADDYRQAIQNLRDSVEDEELRTGQPSLNARRKALLWAGNFAVVFRIECPQTGNIWALKCFTRPVVGQRDRYRRIAEELERARLPFTVDFRYLEQGVRVRGQWFAVLKMRWVEGLTLDKFVEEHLKQPRNLKMLLELWPKLAARLREAHIAHADLQHGNVLLVPQDRGALALRLVDYDGMYVPSLAGTRSGEVGHPAYQHPQRLREGTYNGDVDRFSHLAIYTSIRCLIGGHRELWQQFNNRENLLFRETDFAAPSQSPLFRTLWQSADQEVHSLVGRLALGCGQRLEEVPWLDDVVVKGQVQPLTREEESQVAQMLAVGKATAALPATVGAAASIAQPPPLPPERIEPATTTTGALAATAEGTMPATPPLGRRFRAVGKWLLGSPAAATRPLDALLRRLVGEENDLLRYFLWAILPLLLLGAAWLVASAFWHTSSPAQIAQMSPIKPTADGRKELALDIGGGVKLEMVLIPAGEFLMGSPDSDNGAGGDEKPRHGVRITKPFYMGNYLVTQKQWEAVMGDNPSHFKGPKNPVETICWNDCQKFVEKLNAKVRGGKFSLPTEAQWEYACRAGSTTRYCFGDEESGLGEYAWYGENAGGKTHPVGEKKPNAWGLYDMHGNVWEWCQDWCNSGYYANSPTDDPMGPSGGAYRVVRGGTWDGPARNCRSAGRGSFVPGYRHDYLGFRVSGVPADK